MISNKKFRILECIRQGQIGGGESHLLSLLENLNKDIFEPIVLSFTDGPMVTALEKMGIRTTIIQTEKPFDINIWSKVNSFVKNEKVDIIHAHGTRAASNIFWASKINRIPLIYTIHGWSFHKGQSAVVYTFRKLGETLITKITDLNISVSASNQETGRKEIIGFTSTVVNNGIDLEKFNPLITNTSIREDLAISNHAIIVLFVARFTEHKQPLLLIKAFSKARQSNKNLHLLMVGDGDQKEKGLALVKELGVAECTTFLPFRNDVANILAASDIYVLPSLWEGLPIGLLEAMAMEKAVIGTNVDGTREVIQHNQNGILASGEDLAESIASSIIDLARNRSLTNQLGNNARKSILENYDVVQMTNEIENIYKNIIRKK